MASNLRWKTRADSGGQLRMFGPVRRRRGLGEYRGLEFLEVEARSILTKVPGPPRYGFSYTINPYRGCSHACTYCFARPTHEYLGLGPGEDFDRRIVVKVNAVELARHETAPARWSGELIAMGTNTDPYQPAEGRYRLTRGVLEVLAERRNPASILTKSPLVLRDLDVLADLRAVTDVRVDFSVGTLDESVWKATEPGSPHPRRRIDAVSALNEAGIPSGVLMGPVLPGLSDRPEQFREVVDAAVAAGAVSVGAVPLHLRPVVKDLYLARLEEVRPDLLALHVGLYGDGSYVPAAYGKRVASIVREALGGREAPAGEQLRPARRPEPAADQLSLL